MKSLLFVAPYFAPQAAVGAYRAVKLARRLPQFGLRPVVMCGTFPNDARDEALLAAIPEDVELVDAYLSPALLRARAALAGAQRSAPKGGPTKGLDPFHGLVDRYAVHGPNAYLRGLDLARRHDAKAVFATLGPFSAAPVALAIGKRLSLPVVLDFRDPFALHETGARADAEGLDVRARAFVIRRAEASWMRRAAHVVLNTDKTAAAYRAQYPFLVTKSSVIRNCFDLDLYRPAAVSPPSRFRLLHFGTLRADTPLDDIAGALRRFVDAKGLSSNDIELVQVGSMGEHERRVIGALGLDAFFRSQGRVDQADALGVLRSAHLLVVANTDVFQMRISAKTYDYAASGMPVLALSDNEELDELFEGRDLFARVRPGDIEGAFAVIARRYAIFEAERRLPYPEPPPEALSSTRAAEQLAAIVERVINAGAGRS